MTRDKAKLVLRINEEEDAELADILAIELLVINFKNVLHAFKVEEADVEMYKEAIADAINIANIYSRSLNITLSIDDSVYEFVEGREEEINTFCDSVRVEF